MPSISKSKEEVFLRGGRYHQGSSPGKLEDVHSFEDDIWLEVLRRKGLKIVSERRRAASDFGHIVAFDLPRYTGQEILKLMLMSSARQAPFTGGATPSIDLVQESSTEVEEKSTLLLSERIQCAKLEARVRLLEAQLQSEKPYARLYRLGAGSFLISAISLVYWALTGVGAPFHPLFAAATIPASIAVVIMAFLIRGKLPENSQRGN